MKFSVIIVNYASWPYTLRCIDALYKTGYKDFEVIVVDNDGGLAPEVPPSVRMIRNRTNVGFARACNRGISASKGDYLLLLNPDSLIERGFFESFEKFFKDNPKVGIVGPRIVDSWGNLQLSGRRDLSFLSGLLGRTSFLTKLLHKSATVKRMFPSADRLSGPTEVDWISGACIAIRRRVLEDVGLLDERFFMYFEDADLCRRSRAAGWPVYYLPSVEVLHLTGASSRSKPRAIWMLHKSAFLYHRKHGPHGPLSLYSGVVLFGLCFRALTRLVAS